jgi:hypothetical protein
MRIAAIAAAILGLASASASALSGETRIVSTTSEGKTVLSTTERREIEEGAGLRVEEAGQDGSEVVRLAADGTVVSDELRAKEGTIRMESDGEAVAVSGTWKGKSVSGRCELKGSAFYGAGFEFAARAFARGGFKNLKFMSIPMDKPSKSIVMEIGKEGTEEFRGRAAVKAKLSLAGPLSAFWSARILVDEEGRILRYSGNRGPGTPDFVSELVELRN